MSLLDTLTVYCANQFDRYGICNCCTHPSGNCSGGCLKCSEQVNFHISDGRTFYDCEKLIYYYVCRYSWKYCSEIMYALEQIDFSVYPTFNILSIGCGGAPDLMAFEELISARDTRRIFYEGYDINPYWNPIHNEIHQYAQSHNIQAKFINENIFEVLRNKKLDKRQYNIIILEYLLSNFSFDSREILADKLFGQLINAVLFNRLSNSPFLFIINDIDHYVVRSLFDILLKRLNNANYNLSYKKVHFKNRNANYYDGSVQYSSDQNNFLFQIK